MRLSGIGRRFFRACIVALAYGCLPAAAIEGPDLGADLFYDYNAYSGSLFGEEDRAWFWRRVKLRAYRDLTSTFSAKATVSYEVEDRLFEVDDLYLQWSLNSNLSLQFGRFKEPYSMERLQTGKTQYLTERSAPGNALTFRRNTGVGIFYGQSQWTVSIAGMRLPVEDEGVRSSRAVTGRFTIAPLLAENYFLHLGAGYSQREVNEESYRIKTRLIAKAANERVRSQKFEADRLRADNAELAVGWGDVLLQAEFFTHRIRTHDHVTHNLTGQYGVFLWSIHGEPRRYRKGQIKLGTGKHILELALRVSRTHLITDWEGEWGSARAVAVNYYPDPSMRFTLELEDGRRQSFDDGELEITSGRSVNGRLQYLF